MGSTGDRSPLEVGHQLPAKAAGRRKQAPGGTDWWVSKGRWVGKTTKARFLFFIFFTSPLAFLGRFWLSLAPVTPFLSSATAHQESHRRALSARGEAPTHERSPPGNKQDPFAVQSTERC